VARRQGLITSSFIVGPNGERERLYHSWDYKEPDLAFKQASEEAPAQENLPAKEEEDWF